ncbi:type II secretion system protein [Aquibacillus salsiterrae]|uniref:Type II secretion system GspH family protein n=1 Tax=Aquibacillus salsiterrae TaxID=2950439 RepID=A0A9X4AEU6_9BACI|nr:prepilin-type N-terminal cleavage/methylation domain-containing protein [Aquibacillus salsiterrae]MDC3416979.1 type II secretion system GspH family protein [Aquibacillus salsiterrae]
MKSVKKHVKNQRGLTLIELLVVIVILGIIAAIAFPMVMGQRDKAEENTDKQNLSIVQDAVNRYYAVEGEFPIDDTKSPAVVNDGLIVPDYLQEMPDCADSATATFSYTSTSDGDVKSSCLK